MNFLERLLLKKVEMPSADEALPGREKAIVPPATHTVTGASMAGPWEGMSQAMFGLG